MNKKLTILTIFIILCSIIILGCIDSAQEQEQAQSEIDCPYLKDATISIKINNEKVDELNFSTILQLEQHEFAATHRSGRRPDPIDYHFQGVTLKSILEYKGIDLTNKKYITISAKDGFEVVFEIEEILKNDHMFIVYLKNEKPLGTMENDGSGPYRLIIPDDRFAMRWVKHILEINIKSTLT